MRTMQIQMPIRTGHTCPAEKKLRRLQNIFNISEEDTITIGDGANDLSMFQYAKNKVAFCAKPVVKEHANIIIDNKNLTEILNYI